MTDRHQELSGKKAILLTTLFVLLVSAFLFLAAETFIRYTRENTNLWALTGRKIGVNPASTWALVDAYSAIRGRPGVYSLDPLKTINNHGFISTPDIAVEKPDDVIRIVFLGGSSTAGTGQNLADEDTWPWQAAELLKNKSRYRIEFINAALGGYTTFESYGRLWSRLRFFSPDVIVLYHGWNEMYYFDDFENITNRRTLPDGSWSLKKTRRSTVTYQPLWIDYLIRPSQLLTKTRIKLSKKVGGEVGQSKTELAADYDKRGLDIYRTNLRLIREATSLFGAQLFAVKQATLIVPGLPDADRQRCDYHFHGFDHDAHVEAFNEMYKIMDQEIDNDFIIDATHLSGIPDYFHDHVHLTETGASELAKFIAAELQPFIDKLEASGSDREPPGMD